MIIGLLFAFTLLCVASASAEPVVTPSSKTLPLPGEALQLVGHDAFVILPPDARKDIPWDWYAPTLRGLPAQSEVWMFEQFLAKGIAIAGIDVGESYGSPKGTKVYTKLYEYLVTKRQFREQLCLLSRIRGGRMTPANTMHIGHSSGTEFMDGMIDEVKVWSQALTPEQIITEMTTSH